MKNKQQEIKITLEDVLDIMMEHGIVAGLQLERISNQSCWARGL